MNKHNNRQTSTLLLALALALAVTRNWLGASSAYAGSPMKVSEKAGLLLSPGTERRQYGYRQRPVHSRGRLRNLALPALVAGLMTLTFVPSANAGTYVINNCPSAGNDDAGSWTVFGSPQNVKGTCSGGPGDYIGPRGGYMSPATTAGVQISVPAGSGITIPEAKVWWQASAQVSGATTFAIAADNVGPVDESLTPMTGSEPSTYVLPSTTTEITLANYCANNDAGAGCTFGAGDDNILELYGSQLTLQDTTLPSGTVTGGTLASSGTVSGTAAISYQATDTSSGVRLVQLRVDGEPAAENDYVTSCSYTDFQACPPNVSDTISWNTATVADGQHRVELIVEDAAQNTRVIYTGEVTVQNETKTTSLGALPGPGSTDSTTPGPASMGSAPSSGTPNGTSASETASLLLGLRSTITRPYAKRAMQVTGRLLNTQGLPIAGASLDVLQQADGANLELVGHAQTESNGTFVAAVPPGPSRMIEVGYRAFSADASYAAVAKMTETVHAGVKLTAIPRRADSEAKIAFGGRVFGPVPPQGVIVEILVHYHGYWEPIRFPRTDSHGQFHAVYKFQGGIGRFPFRALVFGSQADFPFTLGESTPVDVTTY